MLLNRVIIDTTHMLLKRKYTYKSSVYSRIIYKHVPGTWATCEACCHGITIYNNAVPKLFCNFDYFCYSCDITRKFKLVNFRYVPVKKKYLKIA